MLNGHKNFMSTTVMDRTKMALSIQYGHQSLAGSTLNLEEMAKSSSQQRLPISDPSRVPCKLSRSSHELRVTRPRTSAGAEDQENTAPSSLIMTQSLTVSNITHHAHPPAAPQIIPPEVLQLIRKPQVLEAQRPPNPSVEMVSDLLKIYAK